MRVKKSRRSRPHRRSVGGGWTAEQIDASVAERPVQWGLLILEMVQVSMVDASSYLLIEQRRKRGEDVWGGLNSSERDLPVRTTEEWKFIHSEDCDSWLAIASALLNRWLEPEWFRRRTLQLAKKVLDDGGRNLERYKSDRDWRTSGKTPGMMLPNSSISASVLRPSTPRPASISRRSPSSGLKSTTLSRPPPCPK